MNNKHKDLLYKLFRVLRHPQYLSWKLRTNVTWKLGVITRTWFLRPLLSQSLLGNIVMFHIGRSGSTVLGDILGQHPKIFWDGEIYNPITQGLEKKEAEMCNSYHPVDPIQLLRKRMSLAGKKRFYGFELKFFHLRRLDINLSDYIKHLKDMGFNHFIVVERRNYLRKLVSSVIARHASKWHQPKNIKSTLSPIFLDASNVQIDSHSKPLILFLQEYYNDFRSLEALLKGQRVLWLTYEDDISVDPSIGYQRIINYLGIYHKKVSIRYGKTNPFKLKELIINFEDLERTLRGTHFEWMLYE